MVLCLRNLYLSPPKGISMRNIAKNLVKKIVKWPPQPAMTIDNLYGYLDAIWHKRDIDGPVVEIGVATGGTTTLACRFLSRIECKKQYFCVDTFGGFVQEQLQSDHDLGLTKDHDKLFSDNSMERVRGDLAKWGIESNVNFIQADICKARPEDLPDDISVCLLDVDLRDPIYDGLKVLHGKLADGGIILVDDCKDGTSWVGANVGYHDFVTEMGLEPKYYMGFGVVEKASCESKQVPWSMTSQPNRISADFYGPAPQKKSA